MLVTGNWILDKQGILPILLKRWSSAIPSTSIKRPASSIMNVQLLCKPTPNKGLPRFFDDY
jgi:hypothetical protein